MSAQSLFRLTAAAAVLGAVLFILAVLLVDPPSISGRLEAAAAPQLLLVAFGVLFLVAVVGLYLRQHREVGMLGLLGAAMTFIGTVLMTSNNYVFAFVVPVLAERAPEFLEPGGGWAQILPVNMGVRIGFSAGLLLFGIGERFLPEEAGVRRTMPASGDGHGGEYASSILAEVAALSDRELAMANQLIESMTVDWEPERYRDTHREEVLELIERKAAGEDVTVAPEPEREAGDVVDLVAALEASLSASRDGGSSAESA